MVFSLYTELEYEECVYILILGDQKIVLITQITPLGAQIITTPPRRVFVATLITRQAEDSVKYFADILRKIIQIVLHFSGKTRKFNHKIKTL